MRLYTWTNSYLSSIQKGIQTAHLVSNLYTKYCAHPNAHVYCTHTKESFQSARLKLLEWGEKHKTIMVLNGGNCAGLMDVCRVLNENTGPYPWTSFSEDEESLNKALTVVGLVLPEMIYGRPQQQDFNSVAEYEKAWSQWNLVTNPSELEYGIVKLLNQSSLAI